MDQKGSYNVVSIILRRMRNELLDHFNHMLLMKDLTYGHHFLQERPLGIGPKNDRLVQLHQFF